MSKGRTSTASPSAPILSPPCWPRAKLRLDVMATSTATPPRACCASKSSSVGPMATSFPRTTFSRSTAEYAKQIASRTCPLPALPRLMTGAWRMPINEHAPASETTPPVPPYWFDGMTGGEMPPGIAAAAALDDFADALSNAPRWLLETGCGGAITLRVCAHRQGERLEFLAELAGECAQLVLEPHALGWLSIAAVCGDQEAF